MRTLIGLLIMMLVGCTTKTRAPGNATQESPLLDGGSPQYQEEIQVEIKRNSAKLRACYEELLKNDPKIQGKVNVRFEIQRSGKVSNAKVKDSNFRDSPGKSEMETCIASVFSLLEFPKFQSAAEYISMTYPVNLRPAK